MVGFAGGVAAGTFVGEVNTPGFSIPADGNCPARTETIAKTIARAAVGANVGNGRRDLILFGMCV
jgi:hypothetical protein